MSLQGYKAHDKKTDELICSSARIFTTYLQTISHETCFLFGPFGRVSHLLVALFLLLLFLVEVYFVLVVSVSSDKSTVPFLASVYLLKSNSSVSLAPRITPSNPLSLR